MRTTPARTVAQKPIKIVLIRDEVDPEINEVDPEIDECFNISLSSQAWKRMRLYPSAYSIMR